MREISILDADCQAVEVRFTWSSKFSCKPMFIIIIELTLYVVFLFLFIDMLC